MIFAPTSDPSVLAALSLGGNAGDPLEAFRFAIGQLSSAPQTHVDAVSSVWRTAPWGKTDQPDFLNMAVLLRTRLPAATLLALCLRIERDRGRTREERWGPRTLDLDIIVYGDATIDQAGLTVPHPLAAERAFVLAPLAEIAPDLRIGGVTAAELLSRVDQRGVKRVTAL